MPARITLKEIAQLTHDTYRLSFDRPHAFDFSPGEATDFALDREGWRNETRPFTFTSQPEDEGLEFVIKSYPDHNGVTERIAGMKPGDTALIGAAWGAIRDAGPGTFIAGGAGITPFIPILRRRARDADLDGCKLIYANKTPEDIILQREWRDMEGLHTVFVTDEDARDHPTGPINATLLGELLSDFSGTFYLCGPPAMGDAVTDALAEHGVDSAQIVTEDKPDEDRRSELFNAT